MIVLHFNMQREDNIEHTNGKVSCAYILVCKRKTCLSILVPSVICIHF